ncbi:hypothetical protein [Mycetocola spongiae]|uniref:hypothetical protein n=1 Tax=Mycetocola spongiae TaxID=2859226 RepID=UPI001CF44F02|nr:hypothetical protein [Mycetocola spongiae]UCR88122.1 hypothetical protein KXZ72_08935 [Mycetocola spongiae]
MTDDSTLEARLSALVLAVPGVTALYPATPALPALLAISRSGDRLEVRARIRVGSDLSTPLVARAAAEALRAELSAHSPAPVVRVQVGGIG